MLNRYTLQVVPLDKKEKPFLFSVNHRIAITDDKTGIAAALVQLFKAHAYHHVEIVNDIPPASDVVIVLNGLAHFSNNAEAIACNKEVFLYAKTIAERFTQRGGLFITVQDTGGQFGLTSFSSLNAWTAGLAGLAKTASHEWPKATCMAIDIERQNQNAPSLANQLFQHILSCSTLESGLPANKKSITLNLIVDPLEQISKKSIKDSNFIFNSHSVLIVSGGGRGVTAACMLALAKRFQPRIAILGRTSLDEEPDCCRELTSEAAIKQALLTDYQAKKQSITPLELNQTAKKILSVREIKATITALKQRGSDVLYFNVDILNATALNDALNEVRKQWGTITGIIHGAGVLADKRIAQKTIEQFTDVFCTKINGLKNLLDATRNDPLRLIALFSSVAARFGNQGQCDYAMANEILNKVAQQEQHVRGKNCLVKSFNWGPWESGMVTPELKSLFRERGIELLPADTGTRMFLDELTASAHHQVEVIMGGRLDQSSVNAADTQHYSVNEETDSFLYGHVIDHVPVLPAFLAFEWFVRTAQTYSPALKRIACQNFKVLKGVRLTGFSQKPMNFSVTCERLQDDHNKKILKLKLLSAHQAPHYTAEIMTDDEDNDVVDLKAKCVSPDSVTTWPWPATDIYAASSHAMLEHRLFHGKALQAIHALQAYSPQGGSGILLTLHQQNWGSEWQTDLLALDGSLQLLRLWTYSFLGYPTLPTTIAKCVLHRSRPSSDYLHCHFRSQLKGNYRSLSDVLLCDEHGEAYASLYSVEMCAVQLRNETPSHD